MRRDSKRALMPAGDPFLERSEYATTTSLVRSSAVGPSPPELTTRSTRLRSVNDSTGEIRAIVAEYGLPDVDPGLVQMLGKKQRVGIQAKRCEQFAANREDLQPSQSSITSVAGRVKTPCNHDVTVNGHHDIIADDADAAVQPFDPRRPGFDDVEHAEDQKAEDRARKLTGRNASDQQRRRLRP